MPREGTHKEFSTSRRFVHSFSRKCCRSLTHIFILVLNVEAVLQEQVCCAQDGLQGHLHHNQPEQQHQLEAGNRKKGIHNHKSYSRQQFEEELGLAVVGGQGVVSGNGVLDHQVADECDVKLGTPVAVTGEKRPKYALMYY